MILRALYGRVKLTAVRSILCVKDFGGGLCFEEKHSRIPSSCYRCKIASRSIARRLPFRL